MTDSSIEKILEKFAAISEKAVVPRRTKDCPPVENLYDFLLSPAHNPASAHILSCAFCISRAANIIRILSAEGDENLPDVPSHLIAKTQNLLQNMMSDEKVYIVYYAIASKQVKCTPPVHIKHSAFGGTLLTFSDFQLTVEAPQPNSVMLRISPLKGRMLKSVVLHSQNRGILAGPHKNLTQPIAFHNLAASDTYKLSIFSAEEQKILIILKIKLK